jgi:membrane-bound serine protease (ClpP class)
MDSSAAALLILGVALLVAEAFLPSFGILGVGGVAAILAGALLAYGVELPGFAMSWAAAGLATVLATAYAIVAAVATLRAHRRRVVTGEMALLGRSGHVVRWDGRQGLVHVHGEDWQARSDAPLTTGQAVRVTAREDLTLIVIPVEPEG